MKAVFWGLGTLVSVSSALGVGLYAVDPLSSTPATGLPYSEVYGMTPDGQYVVGGTRGSDGKLAPYYFNVATQTRTDLPHPAAGTDVKGTGIGYRSAAGELVVAATVNGKTHTWHSSTNSWVDRSPLTTAAVYNSLGVAADGDTYYVGASSANKGYRLTANSGGSSYVDFSSANSIGVQGVSSTGRVFGTGKGISGDANQRAFWTDDGATLNLLPGLDLFTNIGFAYTGSTDGSAIGGMVRDPGLGRYVPARWDAATSALTVLPTLPGTSSTSVMYTMTADGKWGGGMNFIAGVDEQAVLYDMSDASPSNWQTLNLKDHLDGLGFDTSEWVRLGRVTSISADGSVIAGYGIREGVPIAGVAQYTGFVAVIPEPASLGLLALGGLLMVRRKR